MSAIGHIRSHVRARAVAIGLSLWILPSVAVADALDVELITHVNQGQTPKVIVTASEAASHAVLSLTRSDGRHFEFRLGQLAAGARREVPLDGQVGRYSYTGTLGADVEETHQESPLEFQVVVAPPLKMLVDKSTVELDQHRLVVKLSRDPSSIDIKVLDESGGIIAEDSVNVSGHKAGEALVVTWTPQSDAAPARIELVAHDVDDFFTGVALVPWSVRIPHDEVNFAHDSSEIDSSEEPKLAASLEKIKDALDRYKQMPSVKLFVAGHTDTVGAAAYNVGLSRRRAQAIAAWFRKSGLGIPIAYEGFGESALAVQTPDETDEPRNRRADYILAVEEPLLKSGKFHPAWKRIP